MTDPIADFLTRIRNAVKANHKVVEAPGSKIKQEMTKILYEQGYILAYKFDKDEKGHPSIKIALKWDPATKTNAIKDLKRVSRPGLRRYASVSDMPRVLNGLGIAIVSTSKGIMTDAQGPSRRTWAARCCAISTNRKSLKNNTMSRIGKLPVNLPAGVTVEVAADNTVSVKGPLGTLSQKVDSDIKVEVGTHTDVHTGKESPRRSGEPSHQPAPPPLAARAVPCADQQHGHRRVEGL